MDEVDGKLPSYMKNGINIHGVSTTDRQRKNMAYSNGEHKCLKQNGLLPPVADSIMVKQIARELAQDIVHYMLNTTPRNPPNCHANTMRRTVKELSERHDILLTSMAKKLHITEENGYLTFKNVVDEIFTDGTYNWGRIVAVYAFAGRLASYCRENNMDEFVKNIAEFTGSYVSENIAGWIQQQGGWEAFDAYFPEQWKVEDTLWKGLIFTALGLGCIATMVAAR